MVLRLVSTEDFFEVLVLLSLVAVLFSCTTMLRMSPMATARLSPIIGRELPSCQRESASVGVVDRARSRARGAAPLKRDKDGLFILHLSTEFPFGLRVADAHELDGSAVFEHFDLEGDHHGAVRDLRFDDLATMNDRPQAHGARIKRQTRGNAL